MRKRGLGRGFEAIIPTDITGSSDSERITQIPVTDVVPNPHQPRQDFKPSDLQGLADSIRHHGILQPLVVTKTDHGYELIAGERRLRAAKLIGLAEVPAIVRSFDEQQKLELALIENLQRADLNAIETAAAYRKLVDEFNMTPSEIAAKVGQALPTVSNTMRLLNLTPEVQKM
ncbi:MAG TPA: ParB/RepB/Spo0J family partition protein, partial [Candidatus Dormibacteraeota bacterium]|nr:ParB/RepB/Spo0J family partition protein [Candidatus Dormibacteraeota bacterium]